MSSCIIVSRHPAAIAFIREAAPDDVMKVRDSYKTLVPSYLRPGQEPYRSIAAGSYEHCLREALAYGPGAEIRLFHGQGDDTFVWGDCGSIVVRRFRSPRSK